MAEKEIALKIIVYNIRRTVILNNSKFLLVIFRFSTELFGPINIKTPYMGISSYSSFLKEIESYLPSSLIRVKNNVDYYYVNDSGNEYKLDDIADELRTESETVGLQGTIKDHEYVIADGPIYPTSFELTKQIVISS